MNGPLFKDTLRTVKKNFSRYISILLMVALGTAFFTGIKAASPDMLQNAEEYFTEFNLADITVRSTIGLTDGDLEAIRKLDGVEYISGEKFVDAYVKVNGDTQIDIDGTQITARAYSISPQKIYDFTHGVNDGTYINRVQLIEGRYPQLKNECLVDASRLSTPDTYKLGSVISLNNGGGETPDELNSGDFTIVGIIRSPYYISFERGNTDIGSGKLGTFIIIPEEAFVSDYYSEAYIKIDGSSAFEPFSDDYLTYVDAYLEKIKEVSPSLIADRVNEMRPELQSKISEAEKTIASSEDEAKTAIEELDATIATLQNLVDNSEKILSEAQTQFDEKFSEVEENLGKNEAAYKKALNDYSAKRQEYHKKEAEYDQKQTELQSATATYDELYSQYTASQNQVRSIKSVISTTNSLITAASELINQIGDTQSTAYSNEQIQSIITIMQATYPELYSSIKALTTSGLAGEIVANVSPYLESQKAELAKQEQQLEKTQAILDSLGEKLDAEKTRLQQATIQSQQAKSSLQAAKTELDNTADILSRMGYDIQSGNVEAALQKMQAESELNELKAQVSAAPENLAAAKAAKEDIESRSASSLAFARAELQSAKDLYAKLDNVSWTVTDRGGVPGYTSYGQSVSNIEVISNIFPIFFFIISSLVCLTTVTRLVEEDRPLLGTYKALGFSSSAILSKYVIYSISACIFGSLIGITGGIFIFPYAINSAYSIMYSLPEIKYIFPVKYIIIGFIIALFSTTGITLLRVTSDLRLRPAVLMRPKAPKKGKKILLEHIKFLWDRLSFTAKVTARNLFRNKSRFLMTLAGIAGCTALLLGSLGFYNSISAIKKLQYDAKDAISKYDLQIVFDNPQTISVHTAEFNSAASDARISDLSLISMKNMTGLSETNDSELDVYIVVPEKPEYINTYFDLRDRQTGEKYTLDNSGAIITEKLAKTLEVGVGDSIMFKDAGGFTYSVNISAIAEAYTFHYIYLTEQLYTKATGSAPQYSYAIGNISESLKTSKQTDLDNVKGLLATDIVKIDGITTLAYLSDTTESIGEITNALSIVIIVFFVSALILAFVVLYNLSNINIIERTRELATLKVLGFNDSEVNRYIMRENIIVSIFGIAFGIALGIGLHKLLITFTAIDAVMYGQRIYFYSYIISVAITAAFIAAVNLLLRRKTVKIDMVESLKSVE
ncbi:MAG: FtsX-like permease family protein [Oscillospiraceae bacterium]|nr:FtsX-like permease family protein [Oscillospiraceae bacterium]